MNRKLQKHLIDLVAKNTDKGIIKKLCGTFVASGQYRDVYLLKQDDNYVVKVARESDEAHFPNVSEWLNWIYNKHNVWLSKWLAPCYLISDTGRVLIQKRVDFDRIRKHYPKYIPVQLTDTKLKNYGFIGDQLVCCDYQYLIDKTPNKMRYAKWRGSLKK